MQRVGLESLAVVLPRRRHQHPRPRHIHRDRDRHHRERPERHLDRRVPHREPVDRLVDDPHAGHQQQQGFEHRREVLDFAVAVEVRAVRRLARVPHRQERQQRRHEVEPRVRSLGKNAQAARQDPHDDFECRESDGRREGGQRHPSLLVLSGHVTRSRAERLRHQRPSLLLDPPQMLLAREALGVQLVDVLRARRPRREPPVLRHDL